MGKGVYTNSELIDGQFIQFCSIVSQMGQKLLNLRNGVKADLDGKNNVIEGHS